MASLPTVSGFAAGLPRRRKGDALEGWGRRLRERLVAAGPVAARLGIHLGSRVDLFPGTDCVELLGIADRGPASPPVRVAELLARELGGGPDELFEYFEAEPGASGLVSQLHRARLPGGTAVVVEVLHPELLQELEARAVEGLVGELVADGALPPGAGNAAGELIRQLDLRECSLALEELAEETAESPWIAVPRAHLQLCSRCVRVISDLEGLPEAALAGAAAERGGLAARARRLSRGWLALALGGRLFPTEPRARNLLYLSNGRVAYLGGGGHRLPRSVRGPLRDYLAAVAAKQPARAATAFLELVPSGVVERHLRERLRHSDPFRDRGWDVGGDLFVRQVLAHWRTASGLGYHLPDALVPFYRGLFLLNQETRRLAADATPVRDGLREARLLLLFDELREEVEDARWGGTLQRQMNRVGGLPQKLDRILTLAAEDDRRQRPPYRNDSGEASRGDAGAVVVAGLLALTAVVLLTRYLIDAGMAGGWAERLGALVVLLVGGGLLWAGRRGGG